jgi:hypothetical protein
MTAMQRRHPWRWLTLAFSLAALLPSVSGADDAGVEEVTRCVQKNLPPETSRQTVEFRSSDRVGGGRTLEGRISWRRFDDGLSRVLVRLRAPSDLKGAGLLLIEKKDSAEMFVYLPDLEKVRRVTTRMMGGSLFGSDFTYEDFQQVQGMAREGSAERLADTEIDGASVWVIAQHPGPESGSAYEKVVTYVSSDTCVPVKSEMYEAGDRLRKVLTIDPSQIFESNGARIPQRLRMEDHRDKTSTELVVSEIEIGGEIKKRVFSTSYLQRPRAE